MTPNMTTVTDDRSSDESASLLRRDNSYNAISDSDSNDAEANNQASNMYAKIVKANADGTDEDNLTASTSSWIRLWLFFGACILSGGIIPGQNVYSRLFCEAGLFSYACRGSVDVIEVVIVDIDIDNSGGGSCCPSQWLLMANTMNALSVTITFFFFLGGLIFDTIGGQWACVLGCGINASGFLLLATLLFALQHDDDDSITPFIETAVFCISVILVDAGSIITNVSFFGFLWHLPRHQSLILSLSNCCLNVAALIPLVLRFILQRYGSIVSLPSVIVMYAGMIVGIATPLCWVVVPSVDDYRNRAMEVLGMPIPRRSVRGIRGAMESVSAAFRIMKVHARLHYFTMAACIFGWLSPFVYMTMADPLGQEIFGSTRSVNVNGTDIGVIIGDDKDRNGERLASLYNQSSAMLGLLIGPLVGVMLDRYSRPTDGITDLGVIVMISLAVISVFCPVADWTVQFINVSSAAFGQITVLLFLSRYAIIFAPPNRVGAVSGVLVAGLGAATFPLVLGISWDIAMYGSYVRPTVAVCLIGTAIWISYLVFLKRTNPWPTSPIFLPEDEREIAKTFAVGTLEDAAFVSGKSPKEFRRLSSSSNVSDQRALLDAAFTTEAGERIMVIARRRSFREMSRRRSTCSQSTRSQESIRSSELPPILDDDNTDDDYDGLSPTTESIASQYPIPLHLASGTARGEDFTIRHGTASSAIETIEISFNGHGGFGGNSEPTVDWILSPIGPPDDPRRIAATHSMYSPIFSCAEAYGTILEVRVEGFTVASCACFHPNGLEKGSVMQVGSDRYYYSLTMSGATPVYMNREMMGTQTIQRFVGFMQDTSWDEKRKEYGPMFYIAVLGVHPSYQGRGYGKKILNIVAEWADREGMDCYLECSEVNVPIYEKCGYEVFWRGDVTVDGSKISNFGMVRKCQGDSAK